jgi:HSP20 family protein
MKDPLKQTTMVFGAAIDRGSEAMWRPAADIYRTQTGWLVKFSLAGVKVEDIKINISGSNITIDGVRRDWQLEEGCSYYSMEISYSRFERTLEFPCTLDGARMDLESREGLLLVRLHCKETNRE